MSAPHPYVLFATLLGYPSSDLHATAVLCQAMIAERDGSAAASLDAFVEATRGRSVAELEEQYARTFDLNPSRCMDLGYQIFGETYKRGSFLVKMKAAVRAHDLDPGVELPDHLSVVLRLVPLLGANEDPVELATEVVLPVVEKLRASFEHDDGGYRSLFSALEQLLLHDFGVTKVAPLPTLTSDASERGGRRLPMFPGFNPPTERPWS